MPQTFEPDDGEDAVSPTFDAVIDQNTLSLGVRESRA